MPRSGRMANSGPRGVPAPRSGGSLGVVAPATSTRSAWDASSATACTPESQDAEAPAALS
ncbi:hypothetical protein OHT59_06550 [Streptomyces sp. NBC_00243]|uniref:hypothetical protein n=1 Tax=Streptomyces sp. NBC_00243 TaxID=2975688 RepID=UPI002DDAF366|nr:hypothetical protein [Streptomyces sp. NBC_00243]WRZ18170.1 hypothetical protein OHT59_06550 [Streptomyces sp. NBC_00243]